MKTLKTILSAFALAAILSTGAFAQSDANTTVGATATLYSTLTITVNDSLSFGGVAVTGAGLTELSADGNTSTGTGANAQRASVSIDGTESASVTITFTDAILSDGTTPYTVTVDAYDGTSTHTTTAGNGSFSGIIPSGTLDFYLGGEVDFTGATAGVYTTSNSGGDPIDVTVSYD